MKQTTHPDQPGTTAAVKSLAAIARDIGGAVIGVQLTRSTRTVTPGTNALVTAGPEDFNRGAAVWFQPRLEFRRARAAVNLR